MARLVPVQQPLATFHKDEGGKTNNLSFRVLLQGEIDSSCGGLKGEIPLDVVAVFEDGSIVPKQEDVITISGCTEKPNGSPCLCLVSHLGGVVYRLKQVSKRLDDRPVCVRISLKNCPNVPPLQSQGTMVFSKRKNRTQREEQQAKEREEMERKEAEAATLLVHVITPSCTPENGDRPTKLMKVDSASGATSLGDNDDSQLDFLQNSVDTLSRRVADLEKIVSDQQKLIEDMRIFMPIPAAPNSARRSASQALWNIPTNMPFLFPPSLRRDTSTESFPDINQIDRKSVV